MSVKSEALRYLGYGENAPDSRTEALLDKAIAELRETAAPKFCYKAVGADGDDGDISGLLIGDDIKAHVAGCERLIFFAATLGAPADTLIRRAEISDMAYAVIIDAAASAMIEELCDGAEAEIRDKLGIPAEDMTWRYSPGYGDYPVTVQGALIRFLQADKHIGLTATESSALLPGKSVTAVIGVKSGGTAHAERSCENCSMKDTCKFRKGNKSCGHNK